MLAEASNFWTHTYPLIALGILMVAILCYKVAELKAWVPVNVRRALLVLGLLLTGAEAVRVRSELQASKNSAALYLHSDKRDEVTLSLDGKPLTVSEVGKARAVILKTDAPNILEVRQGQELVGSLPLANEIYVVNCSNTVTIACEEVIYSSSPRLHNALGDDGPPRKPEFLLQGKGRGIFLLQKKNAGDYITGFTDTPPPTIQTSYKAGEAPPISIKTMWWLHTEK